MKLLPVAPRMCATCPFRAGSPYAQLARDLADSALSAASRICHSTGSNNAINRRTGRPAALCRGARDVQLQHFYRIGFLSAPTDAAWNAKCAEMNLSP
jgi:hypothetical protein